MNEQTVEETKMDNETDIKTLEHYQQKEMLTLSNTTTQEENSDIDNLSKIPPVQIIQTVD